MLRSTSMFWLAISLLAICAAPLRAQTTTATLSGTIADESGAVVPEVAVTIMNVATHAERETRTSKEGQFLFALLPPGRYTLTGTRDGFTPIEVRELVLNVGDQIALRLQLKVAAVGDTVTVVAEPPRVNTSPAVGTIVDRQFIANLALNGRSLQPLLQLTPGVVPTVVASSDRGQFSVNGQRASANYFMVDGVSANVDAAPGPGVGQTGNGSMPALTTVGGTTSLVSIEALEEFQVLSSTYAPEHGRTPGGQISIVTRSGTNEFHGSLFNYFRNDALDAANWFVKANRLAKPELGQNNFGGVLGGPVVLPGFRGTNRTFFFFSYEGLRLRQPVVATTDVPSLATRQNAPADIRPYLSAFPVPTGADNPATGLAPYVASYSKPSVVDATSLRLDYHFGGRSTIFGRYNYTPSSATERSVGLRSLNSVSTVASTTQTLTIGHNYVLSPAVVHESRVNYSRVHGSSVNRLDDFGGATVPPDSILFPAFASSESGAFAFRIQSGNSTAFGSGRNADNLQRQINIVDSLSVAMRSHALKFGVDYRRLVPQISSIEYSQGIAFSTIAQVMQATAASVTVVGGGPPREPAFTNLSLYAQDTWSPTLRLTVSYGLRWDYNPPPHEVNGNEAMTVTGLDNPATLSLAPRGTPLYSATRDNFAPRVGASYLLWGSQGHETVLRGGFGVFYDLGNGQIADAYRSSVFPFDASRTTANVAFPLNATAATPPPISATVPVLGVMSVAEPDLKLPYTLQWNVAVERSLGSHQAVSATYVGAAGRRLTRRELLLAPNASFRSSINVFSNRSTSDYDALQLQYRRRLSGGVQALASYTWGRSLDDLSIESGAPLPLTARRGENDDRGPSDFDIRHAFSTAVTYEIPAPRNSALTRFALGGWAVDTLVQARSAPPVDVIGTTAVSGGYFYNLRPDSVPGVPEYLDDSSAPGGRRLNPAAFVVQPGPRQGTLNRNALRGFPFFQIDATLRRQFALAGTTQLQFRADVFNLFNRANFGPPGRFLSTPSTFGRATSTYGDGLGTGGIAGGFNPLYQSGGPRSIQLSLKLVF